MKLSKIATYRKYSVNVEAFLREDDVSFYLLGAYMTDGHIVDGKHHLSFGITSKDLDWIEIIRAAVCPTKPIYSSKQSECHTLSVSDINCMNWLISYGCTPRKSKTLKLERPIPEKYHADFWRGLIDGDGSISTSQYKKTTTAGNTFTYKKTGVYLCSASYPFIEQVAHFVPDGINYSIVEIKPENIQSHTIRGKKVTATCSIYRLHFNDSNAKNLLAWMYYPMHKMCLPRKRNVAFSLL